MLDFYLECFVITLAILGAFALGLSIFRVITGNPKATYYHNRHLEGFWVILVMVLVIRGLIKFLAT